MYVMFILMAFSLTVSLIFLGAYIWSVKSGQFDDKYTPSVRMLFEDKKTSKKTEPGLNSGKINEENK
ncbi:MAG: cbb3-type cytochrome oxidase assembly protein CcoS [Candidatus Marinimicrobia bacterium]|nr:cbb3-type cytochrome oxidase assembly protein CcoS [Candidatus Neomarinimicrobiota bacterium]MBT4361120.1 cbb3-type cytochrome oxidase assembly protein CcoS [Candidatus Neomarinimicrobiota bacterium]MBT4713542.1 cbb3-type cytochrome oxidase assembly protein CcoS [Candidatus Neomarinimicrobiota bacterium]MBT4946646.1 cbb3-type cytochrome oxidase assembly protein CcoS [Candidatus Neomarinimicrobiota bacterium]MBT5268641.1 cbb3-type cytochrome oxidase assembly protein CcoS [Candidatus Neomarini